MVLLFFFIYIIFEDISKERDKQSDPGDSFEI